MNFAVKPWPEIKVQTVHAKQRGDYIPYPLDKQSINRMHGCWANRLAKDPYEVTQDPYEVPWVPK